MSTLTITPLASDFGTGQVFWSMLWFFCFFIWIWLLTRVFADIFRSHDMSGWAKALWIVFVIVLPYLGVLVYLIARGDSMHERAVQEAKQEDREARRYIQDAAGAPSTADQLSKLADLRERGVITADEFEREKAKILA